MATSDFEGVFSGALDAAQEEHIRSLASQRKVPAELVRALVARSAEAVAKGHLSPKSDILGLIHQLLRALNSGTVAQYAKFLGVTQQNVRATLVAAGTAPDANDRITTGVRRALWRYLRHGRRSKALNSALLAVDADEEHEDSYLDPEWDRSGDTNYNPPWDHEPYWKK